MISRFVFISILVLVSCKQGKKIEYDLTDKRILMLIGDFSSSDWGKVYRAKDSLERLEKTALPYLFALMSDENKQVKLTNTADLIYPGATEFYGHGWVIDYDLDWLASRAGWAIEDITFQNFNFRENKITEGFLFDLERDSVKYQKYLETGSYEFGIDPDKYEEAKLLASNAISWWETNSESWTRLDAVREAIESIDTVRQMHILSHLRGGQCITGLNVQRYKDFVEPSVRKLMNSKNLEIRQQAKLLDSEVNVEGEWVNVRTRCLE